MKYFSSSGKCQLSRVSAEYASDSYVIFTIEIVVTENTKHFMGRCMMYLLMVHKFSQENYSLLFQGGGK